MGENPSSVGVINKYLYQGKELQTDLGLNLYDFHARQYDPLLGRFNSSDPQSQFASGYTGMGNNPVLGVDPSGEFVFTAIALGMIINTGIQMMAGNVDGTGDFFMAAAIGGASGAAGFGAGNLVAGAVGTIGAVGGGLTGASGGLASGFVGGAGSAWAGGANFGGGLRAGAVSGGLGAATGGLIGGISGGISSVRHSGNFWSGDGATFASYADGAPIAGERIDYNNKTAREFADKHFKSLKYHDKVSLQADGMVKNEYYEMDGDWLVGTTGKNAGRKAYAITQYNSSGRGSHITFAKNSFSSARQLYTVVVPKIRTGS